ncbi:MAG TPA: hypothetical protein VGQ17_16390 [Gemmatimonadales bacterium]|jgi:hypothetical protein|nr:hypothetical protein [Gemmatimonadales bacterium]
MALSSQQPTTLDVVQTVIITVFGIAAAAWTIPKSIAAVGAAVGLAAGGAAATATPWAAPVASVGLGVTGVTLLVMVLVRASKEARREPYEWTLPILGIGGSLFLDISKEFAVDNAVLKIALSAAIAYSVVVAGALYKRGGVPWRTIAILLVLLPPSSVLVQNMSSRAATGLSAAIREIPTPVWIRIGGFVLISSAVALLHYLTRRDSPHNRR